MNTILNSEWDWKMSAFEHGRARIQAHLHTRPLGNEGFKDRQIFVKKTAEMENDKFGCMIFTFCGQKYKSVISYFPTEISDLIQIRPIFG